MVEKSTSNKLKDPMKDRKCNEVPLPPAIPLSIKDVFTKGDVKDGINMKVIRDHLGLEGTVAKELVTKLVLDATKVFKNESNILKVQQPVVIIGDIHGQYFDMIHMFEKVIDPRGGPPNVNLLFLGDYVDRGFFSLEVLVFLYALKIKFPKEVIMLRGNHESRAMTEHFTFRSEILSKFQAEDLYEMFIDSFEAMPIAADVNGDYLCMHGGVSPDLHSTKDIDKVNRFIEPPLKGFLCDLLWADPLDDKDARKLSFTENAQRECSVKFGLEPVKKLFAKNHYLSIIRAHQVQHDGYKMHRWGGQAAFPSVITVFSAPNYCGEYHNKGAVILIENEKMNIKQYKDVKQPFHLPGDLDLFQWSIPFLLDKVADMLIKLSDRSEDPTPRSTAKAIENMSFGALTDKIVESQQKDIDTRNKKVERMQRVRAKVLTIARMNRMLDTMRQNKDAIDQIKMEAPDGKVPVGVIQKGPLFISETLLQFHQNKTKDQESEAFPVRSRRLSLKTRQIHNIEAQQEGH